VKKPAKVEEPAAPYMGTAPRKAEISHASEVRYSERDKVVANNKRLMKARLSK